MATFIVSKEKADLNKDFFLKTQINKLQTEGELLLILNYRNNLKKFKIVLAEEELSRISKEGFLNPIFQI